MSFDKLTKEELLRTLDNDFAFALEENERKTKASILAAVTEGGLKFQDYLVANPDKREQFAPVSEPVATADPLSVDPLEPVEPIVGVQPLPESTVVGGVHVKSAVAQVDNRPYLIKMTRLNPYYEIGSYKFTKTHPYALVDAHDAEHVLREEGFRQAYPSELEEFYS